MTTPQQFLESFLRAKTAVYAETNKKLAPVYNEYFGEPLLQRTDDLLLGQQVEQVEDVKQSATNAIVITCHHFKGGDLRRRYHLAAIQETWKIVEIEWECFLCHGSGRRRNNTVCHRCGGEGWYDPRKNES